MRRVWLKQLKRRVCLMAEFDAAYVQTLAEAMAMVAPAATPAAIPAPAATPACSSTNTSTSLHQQPAIVPELMPTHLPQERAVLPSHVVLPPTVGARVVLPPTAGAHVVLPPTAMGHHLGVPRGAAPLRAEVTEAKSSGKGAEAKGRSGKGTSSRAGDHLSKTGRRYHSDGTAASSSHTSRLKRSLKRLAKRHQDEAMTFERGHDDENDDADEARDADDADDLVDL
jgi:hypothetical protein